MSKWIVWSKPAPIKVLAAATVLAVLVAIPLMFILLRFGVRPLVARVAVALVAIMVGRFYVDSRKPKSKQA